MKGAPLRTLEGVSTQLLRSVDEIRSGEKKGHE